MAKGGIHKALMAAILSLSLISNAMAAGFIFLPPADNWNKVQQLPPGENIMVIFKKEGQRMGDFVRLTEDSIYIKEHGSEQSYRKDAISRVQLIRRDRRGKRTALTGIACFAAGFTAGYLLAPIVSNENGNPTWKRGELGLILGAGAGGIATLVSLRSNPDPPIDVIYRAAEDK